MMMDRTVVLSIGAALVLLLTVLEMVRRRRLKEEYSLLWLATAFAIILLAGNRALLAGMAALMGIHYPPSALMVIGFGFLVVTTLHFSGVVSRLRDENKNLAQELAILRWQVAGIPHEAAPGRPAPPEAARDA
jgi:hypothetical protein